jgi:hypothetical protein
MNLGKVIAVGVLLAVPAFLDAQTSDTAGWKTYRNESGEYQFRFPDTLHLSIPTGKTCSNGECKAIENVMLSSLESNGPGSVKSMSFMIQRGINPQRLPIQQWYEGLAHRPLRPDSEAVATVGGKAAIRRGPLVNAVTVHTEGGKTVSRSEGMVPDDTLYVPLNSTDVLTVSSPSGSALSETYAKVRSTLTFTK